MSHSFYVRCARPNLRDLFAAVGDSRLHCEDLPADPTLPDGWCVHPFLVGVGARGVEIAYEDGVAQIRVMSCSTRGDHELALAIVAVCGGAEVQPEDAPSMTLAAFASDYAPAWLEHHLASGPRSVLALVEEKKTTLQLAGARRVMHIGPRFVGELEARAEGRGTSVGDELLAAQAELQSLDLLEDVFAARVFQVGPPVPAGSVGDAAFTYATWSPACDALLPPADRYALLLGDGGAFMVPSEAGPAIGGDAWRYLDELHARAAPLRGDAWDALIERARPHAIAGTARRP